MFPAIKSIPGNVPIITVELASRCSTAWAIKGTKAQLASTACREKDEKKENG
jgi:hypothetical protein